jgi:hypothetical protein
LMNKLYCILFIQPLFWTHSSGWSNI